MLRQQNGIYRSLALEIGAAEVTIIFAIQSQVSPSKNVEETQATQDRLLFDRGISNQLAVNLSHIKGRHSGNRFLDRAMSQQHMANMKSLVHANRAVISMA
jgi:hypothetical protein